MNERGSGLRARGEVQDFEKLRAECRRSGRLFEDPEFPATDCSIFFSRTPPRPFQWKRPHVSPVKVTVGSVGHEGVRV